MMAVWGGHLDIVDHLIATGADVNHQTASGETALHFAALKNNMEIAEHLFEHGASVNAQTTQGTTDMYSGSPQVVGESPLHIAARHGHSDFVELLVSNGARKEVVDHSGETPRQWAKRYDQHHVDDLLA